MRNWLKISLLLLFLMCASVSYAEIVSFCGMDVDTLAAEIDFGDIAVDDVEGLIALIERMPNLTRVDMYASRLEHADMARLFDGYPHIRFGWTVYMGKHVVRTDATSFSTLHGKCPEHDEAFFEPLRYCLDLVALDLGHNRIRDISFLRHFPHMKVLILACNQIEDISVLAELKELEYLELFSNRFKDATPLAQLPQLRDLNISNNPVNDITSLHQMDQLERFWCTMNDKRITRQERKDMEQALPDCKFYWDGQPTLGGWREHPHYDTIYAIFNQGGYRPFDQ